MESEKRLNRGLAAAHAEQRRRKAAGLPIGRPKGTPNKLTSVVREAVLRAYYEIGGQEALTAWARKHPGKFYALMFKLVAREREPNPGPRSVEVFIQTANGAVPVERRRSMFDERPVIDDVPSEWTDVDSNDDPAS